MCRENSTPYNPSTPDFLRAVHSTTTHHLDQSTWIVTVAVLALVVFAGVLFLSSVDGKGLSVNAHVGGAESLNVQLIDGEGAFPSEG